MARDVYKKIWRAVSRIPRGFVASYGQIAQLAGNLGGARMVGFALNRLADDSPVPWHRVINARGRISFPADSQAYARKAERLAEEGVELIHGHIDLDRFRWQPSLDELIWKLDDVECDPP